MRSQDLTKGDEVVFPTNDLIPVYRMMETEYYIHRLVGETRRWYTWYDIVLSIGRRLINQQEWVFVAREDDDPYIYPGIDILHACGYRIKHFQLAKKQPKQLERWAGHLYDWDQQARTSCPPYECETMIAGTRHCPIHEDLPIEYKLGRYIELDPKPPESSGSWGPVIGNTMDPKRDAEIKARLGLTSPPG